MKGIEKYLIDIQKILCNKKDENATSKIIFQPWVGRDYESQKPKILILGESHYEGEQNQEKKWYTHEIIKEYALRTNGKTLKFFTIIAKVVSNRTNEWLSNEDSNTFWNKVAFYNFVQDFVGKRARIRPSNDSFEQSSQAFEEVLSNLNPDISSCSYFDATVARFDVRGLTS